MTNVDEFISKWQHVEKLIKERALGNDTTRFNKELDIVASTDSLVAKKRGLIEDLYSLRNVYSHRDRSRYIATIEKQVLVEMDKILELLKNPPTVVDLFGCSVYTGNLDKNIRTVMDKMTENEFTHVPIYKDNELIGIFSYNSFFEWVHDVLNKKLDSSFEKKLIRDINPKYLNSPVIRYEVLKSADSAGKVLSIFKKNTSASKRLDCILITKDGSKNSKPIGIITPWDLYKVW